MRWVAELRPSGSPFVGELRTSVLRSLKGCGHFGLDSLETCGHSALKSLDTRGHPVLKTLETCDHRVLKALERCGHALLPLWRCVHRSLRPAVRVRGAAVTAAWTQQAYPFDNVVCKEATNLVRARGPRGVSPSKFDLLDTPARRSGTRASAIRGRPVGSVPSHGGGLWQTAADCGRSRRIAADCDGLRQTATDCGRLRRIAADRDGLRQTATD